MLSPNLLDYVGCVAELHAVDIRETQTKPDQSFTGLS